METKDFALKYESGAFDDEKMKNENICQTCGHRAQVHNRKYLSSKRKFERTGCKCNDCPCKKFEKKEDKE